MIDPANRDTLDELRSEIDRIDAALHFLLMERGEIIHRLIEAKAQQGGGSAFRPGREAEMMRNLVSRHKGLLPLDTVEGIWRIIISTFTFIQANYSVHADVSGGDAAMRDSCRFHFGFTVPYVAHNSADEVIKAITAARGDLGVVQAERGGFAGPWWRGLAAPNAPKIIARLPFVERPDHPAGMPIFVIAEPLAEASARDVVLYDVTFANGGEGFASSCAKHGLDVLGECRDKEVLSLMVAATDRAGNVGADITSAFGGDARLAEIGSHAARFDLGQVEKVAAQ
jgi:chorismate mutase